MTTDKAFKRVVRARMAKTGERYAAARRALIDAAADAEPTADATTPSGYRMRGGLHPETATLATSWPIRRRLGPDGRAVDRGRHPRHRRRPGRRLHPLGIQEPPRAGPHPRFRNQWYNTRGSRLDRQPRSARHRARPARDRRPERGSRGTRCTPGRGCARHCLVDPQSLGTWCQPSRDVGGLRPGRRRVRT